MMKKLVINLTSREDRLFNFRNKNFKSIARDFEVHEAIDGREVTYPQLLSLNMNTQRDWIDPFARRKLSKGEVGCFLSHTEAWKTVIQSGEPHIIFEDDAQINHDLWDEAYYESVFKKHPNLDFLYLQHNENTPAKAVSIDDKLVQPYYPYNMTAYIITPRGAIRMLQTYMATAIKPIDEWLPTHIQNNVITAYALKEDAVKQAPREKLVSDIEVQDGDGDAIFPDFNVHITTVGTDRKRMTKLLDSANHYNIGYVRNLGNCVDWHDPMLGRGGGKKLSLIKQFVNQIDENDVIIFTDSYDVVYADHFKPIIDKYLGFNTRVLFSAESTCWPNSEWADRFPKTEHAYRFLNSGTFIGRVKDIKEMLEDFDEAKHDDDQEYMQEQFLSGKWDCKLDTEAYLFQCHDEAVTKLEHGQLYNPITNCCPSIYHGNGGEHAAKKLDQVYKSQVPQSPMLYLPVMDKVQIMEKDMLLVNFMNASQCERLIELADANGNWAPLPDDKFPAYEIRMKEMGLFKELEAHWQKELYPIIEKYWHPIEMYGLRDAFVMRYSEDTQKNLALHNDASMVTGSVKLNDDYEGADLVFPRQQISNKEIPVGSCILFPGMVTHGHTCEELTKGVKYSLTMWSSRYTGDVI